MSNVELLQLVKETFEASEEGEHYLISIINGSFIYGLCDHMETMTEKDLITLEEYTRLQHILAENPSKKHRTLFDFYFPIATHTKLCTPKQSKEYRVKYLDGLIEKYEDS